MKVFDDFYFDNTVLSKQKRKSYESVKSRGLGQKITFVIGLQGRKRPELGSSNEDFDLKRSNKTVLKFGQEPEVEETLRLIFHCITSFEYKCH